MAASTTRPVAAIVDGYSTGNFLPDAFDRLGVDVVHVQSTQTLMSSMLAPALPAYVGNVVRVDGSDLGQVAEELARYEPVAVLAGQEPGVPLADALSERMGLASNGSALSFARRDKYTMIETVRAAGLHCARQFTGSSPDELAQWAERDAEYPVVVKPLSSASTDGVSICHDADEVRAAAAQVLASRDIFDAPNTAALVQSYLDGTEYIVDTVSVEGRHYVCGVWEYEKTTLAQGKKIYDKDVLRDPGAAPVPELIAYVRSVLDAMHIMHGPVHIEVMVTPDGPALVEIGARLNGNMHPDLHNLCVGANQADLTAMAYARPHEFLDRYADRVYEKRQEAIVHNTATVQSGVVDEINESAAEKIRRLDSVFLLSVKFKPGKQLKPTTDLLTSPLRIFMLAEAYADILGDYERIQFLKDEVYLLR